MNSTSETTSRFNLVWLLSYISIASVSAAIITPALPKIQAQYALNLGAVEWVVSAFLIGYVVGQLIYAPLANQLGRLKALRIGLLINLIGIAICLMAVVGASFWVLILGRLITALGAASGLACTFMLINEWLPESQRKTAMAYSVLSFALGVGLAVMIGGMITDYWQWQGCFWFLLLHGLIMLWGTCIFSETLVTPKPIRLLTIIHDYSIALSSSKLLIYSLVVGTCSAIAYCFSAAGPQVSEDLLQLSAVAYGYWNSLNIVGMLVGGLFVKQLLARLTVNQVIGIGFVGIALGIVNLFMIWGIGSQSALWFFLTTASLYLFSSLLFSGGSFIASNALADKASAAAMMGFVNMCFATLCVILMGYLVANPLLGFAIILTLVCLLVVGLLCLKNRIAGALKMLLQSEETLKQLGLVIQVIQATVEQKPIIEQLYELYTYEMTDLADFDIGDNGYYGYADLHHYWIDSNRFPYLVYVNKKLAGFVLVQKGSPIDNDPDVWDIAEFFIMRKFRRKGIGQFVAQQIWEKYAGPWQIRVWDNNKSAHSFWDGIIKRYSKNTAMLTKTSYQGHDGLLIYKFNTTD